MIVPGGDARIAITTAGSREEAEQIGRTLVEERLAACVNLLPGVTSVYRWREEMETAEEVLLAIKTTAVRLEELEAAVRRLHSYEVPEFVVLHPESMGKAYMEWVAGCVTPRPGDAARDSDAE